MNNRSESFKVTSTEKKKYVLKKGDDFAILKKCKELEKIKLPNNDRVLAALINICDLKVAVFLHECYNRTV